MSTLSVTESNYLFLEVLTGKESIGIDQEDRLYRKKECLKPFNVCSGQDPLLHEIVSNYVLEALKEKKYNDFKEGFLFYYDLGQRVSRYMTTNEKEQIANRFFEARREVLFEGEKDKTLAEAMLTTEMSLDSCIPKKIKKLLRPLPPPAAGASGAYFIKDRSGNILGIFKPSYEEYDMPQKPFLFNQRNFSPSCPLIHKGFVQGTGWIREIAAWKMVKKEFGNIPYTTEVTLPLRDSKQHPVTRKIGSFQSYVKGKLLSELSRKERKAIPSKSICELAAIDLLFGNGDRHFGNAIWDADEQKLYPIDHGLVFLESLDWKKEKRASYAIFLWTRLAQAKGEVDPEIKKWILEYNVRKKIEILHKIGASSGSIHEHRVRVYFVKEGVRQGFSLAALGKMSMRAKKNKEVPIESLITKALENRGEKKNFYREFRKVTKAFFEDLKAKEL